MPSQNAEYRSVNAPWTYFFSPAGPDRSVVSSNPATGAAVISVRISSTTSATSEAALARQEWMNPSDTSAPVTSAISCAHRSTGTCWKTTRYTASARSLGPIDSAESGTPAGRGATCGFPQAHRACAGRAGPARRRDRDLLLLKRPGNAQVSRAGQVRAARAPPSG